MTPLLPDDFRADLSGAYPTVAELQAERRTRAVKQERARLAAALRRASGAAARLARAGVTPALVDELATLAAAIEHGLNQIQAPERYQRIEPDQGPSAEDLLAAVLLFHAAGPWTPPLMAEWMRLTGTSEATTRTLCDAIRNHLVAGQG